MKWRTIIILTISMILCIFGGLLKLNEKSVIERSELFLGSAMVVGERNYYSIPLVKKKDKETGRKVIRIEYGFNHKITEWDDGTGNAIIGGQMYADSTGTKIEDATSLKDCEFCDDIKLAIDSDGTHLVNVLDYNYTSLTVELFYNESNLGEYEHEVTDNKMKTKLKVIESNGTETEYEIEVEEGEKLTQTVPFGFSKAVEFGENSTTLIINDTGMDGGYSGGVNSVWINAHGGAATTSSSTKTEARSFNTGGNYYIYRMMLGMDTSVIPDGMILENVSFHFYATQTTVNDNDGDDFAVIVHGIPYSSGGYPNVGDSVADPTELSDRLDLSDMADNNWHYFTYNDLGIANISLTTPTYIGIREGHDVLNSSILENSYSNFIIDDDDKLYYLNVTYSPPPVYILNITDPTTDNQATLNPSEILTATYNFSKNEVDLTTNIKAVNMSVGDNECPFVQNELCTGTPSACSTFTTEDNCSFVNCTWATGSPVSDTQDFADSASEDWANWGSQGSGISWVENQAATCVDDDNDDCMDFDNCDTDTIAKQSDIDMSGCLDGTGLFEMKLSSFGNEDSTDCGNVHFSGDSGDTWSADIEFSCDELGDAQFDPTPAIDIPDEYLTANFRYRLECEGFTGSGELWGLDDFNISCEAGDSCSGNPLDCNVVNYTEGALCENNTGCAFTNTTQETFVTGKGWEVNCTIDAGCTGVNNLFLMANYTTDIILRNETEVNAVDCGGAADTDAPNATNLRNTSTTNQSSDIEFDCDEACNYTMSLYNDSDMNVGNLVSYVSNLTLLTSHTQNFSVLQNNTDYHVNLSVFDNSSNERINDTFNFTTAQNPVVAVEKPTYAGVNTTLQLNSTRYGMLLKWRANYTGVSFEEASPAYKDKYIYVVSRRQERLFKLSSVNGSQVWNYTIDDTADGSVCEDGNNCMTYSTPLIDNDVVYLPIHAHYTGNGSVFAINATTGEHIWNYTVPAGARDALYDEDKIYFSNALIAESSETSSAVVYALNKEDGTVNWSTIISSVSNGHNANMPLIANGSFYTMYYLSKVIVKLNTTDGNIIWNISGESAYWDNSIVTDSRGRICAAAYLLWNDLTCYNETNGLVLWNQRLEGFSISYTSYYNEGLYVADIGGHVYKFNSTNGNLSWKYRHADYFDISSITIANNLLFIGSKDPDKFFILNETDGSILLEEYIGGGITSVPVVADGNLFIVGNDDYVYAYDIGVGDADWVMGARFDLEGTGHTPNGLTSWESVKVNCSKSQLDINNVTCTATNSYDRTINSSYGILGLATWNDMDGTLLKSSSDYYSEELSQNEQSSFRLFFGCPYTYIDCSDNKKMTANCDNQGYNITVYGAGSFTMDANITNYGKIDIVGTNETDMCCVDCGAGCFI